MSELPGWAQSERGEVVGCYDHQGEWIHKEPDGWYNTEGWPVEEPSGDELIISDSVVVKYTSDTGAERYATIHAITPEYDLDEAIHDLDDADSGRPA